MEVKEGGEERYTRGTKPNGAPKSVPQDPGPADLPTCRLPVPGGLEVGNTTVPRH